MFFDYLEGAPREALILSKQLFPWKFDCNLRKKDFYDPDRKFVDENYLQTFLDLLERAMVDISKYNTHLNLLFPWKSPFS